LNRTEATWSAAYWAAEDTRAFEQFVGAFGVHTVVTPNGDVP